MESTTKTEITAINQQFKRKAIAISITTFALIGIALEVANRYGLSLNRQIMAAGVPAWCGALFLADAAKSRNSQLETRRSI